jgi:hypothetical protein
MPFPHSLALAAVLAGAPVAGADFALHSAPSAVRGPSPIAADTLYGLGRFHGISDARVASTRGDFVRGFGWSLIGGPLGGIIAVRRASSASLPFPEGRRGSFLELGADYRDGYHEGFEAFFPPRQREATIAGAMLGSVAFGFILLQVVDLPGRRQFKGEFPDGEPTFIIYSIPVGSR